MFVLFTYADCMPQSLPDIIRPYVIERHHVSIMQFRIKSSCYTKASPSSQA